MAALASTAVSLYPTSIGTSEFQSFGPGGVRMLVRRLKLVLTGQGGATNTIGATALGFKTLVRCSNLLDVTNSKSYQAVVDPVNNVILLSAIAADTFADITTTVAYITVEGYN
jgi:hypothetical protein